MYEDYKFWRKQGFRAISAAYIAKYGFMQYIGWVFDWE